MLLHTLPVKLCTRELISQNVWILLLVLLAQSKENFAGPSPVNFPQAKLDLKKLYDMSRCPLAEIFCPGSSKSGFHSFYSANYTLPPKVKFITHGFQTDPAMEDGIRLKDEILSQCPDVKTVFLLDWTIASGNWRYDNVATNCVPYMAAKLALKIGEVLSADPKIQPENIELIGHSLGAHISGQAGKLLKKHLGLQIGKIIGLDPAGPTFTNKPTSLGPDDAKEVVAYHTNTRGLGMDADVGHKDIYVNGGDLQPECLNEPILLKDICSHSAGWKAGEYCSNSSEFVDTSKPTIVLNILILDVSVTVLFDYQLTNVFVTGAKVLKAMPIGTHAAVMSFVTSPKVLHPADYNVKTQSSFKDKAQEVISNYEKDSYQICVNFVIVTDGEVQVKDMKSELAVLSILPSIGIIGTLMNPFSPLNLGIKSLAKLNFYAELLVMKAENECFQIFTVLVGNSNNISLLEKLASKGKGVPAISQSKFDALYAAGSLPDRQEKKPIVLVEELVQSDTPIPIEVDNTVGKNNLIVIQYLQPVIQQNDSDTRQKREIYSFDILEQQEELKNIMNYPNKNNSKHGFQESPQLSFEGRSKRSIAGNYSEASETNLKEDDEAIIEQSTESSSNQTMSLITARLVSPDNQVYSDFIWDSTSKLTILNLTDMETGTWHLIVTSSNEEKDGNDEHFLIFTTHQREINTPPVKLKGMLSSMILKYPDGIKIQGMLVQGEDDVIIGANVTAKIVSEETGEEFQIFLLDNGAGADEKALDGIYSRFLYKLPSAGRFSINIVATNSKDAINSARVIPFAENPWITMVPTSKDLERYKKVEAFQRSKSLGSIFSRGNYSQPPPSPVTDLDVTSVDHTDKNIHLEWTASGNEMDSGTAASIQLSASGFGNDTLDDFIIVGGSLDPLPAGEHQHVILKIPDEFWNPEEVEQNPEIIFNIVTVNTEGEYSQPSNSAPATLSSLSLAAQDSDSSTFDPTQAVNNREAVSETTTPYFLYTNSNQSPDSMTKNNILILILVSTIVGCVLVISVIVCFCVWKRKYQAVSQVEMQ